MQSMTWGDTSLAVASAEASPDEDFVYEAGPAAEFLASVLEHLGDLRAFAVLDITGQDPRITVSSASGRIYGITLPGEYGPYEIWASVEIPIDDPTERWFQLREREEVLAQALHTTRLAWHRDDRVGWIGLPVELAFEPDELDSELAGMCARHLRQMLTTVERISKALDERASAREARQLRRGRIIRRHADRP